MASLLGSPDRRLSALIKPFRTCLAAPLQLSAGEGRFLPLMPTPLSIGLLPVKIRWTFALMALTFDMMSLSKSEFPPLIVVTLLALLGGGLLAVGYSNDPIWWTTWLAPAPALAAMLMAPFRMRRAVGLAIGLVAGVLSFSYHVETGSVVAAVLIAIAYAMGWASTLKLAADAAERVNAVVAALVLPLSWAAIDTLLIHLSPHGSMGSLAYSQGGLLAIQQLASLGGVPLITFVVLLPGSAVGLAIAYASGMKSIRLLPHAIGLAIVLSVAAILFGLVRLNSAPPPTGPTVALIAVDRIKGAPRDWTGFVDNYGEALDRAARPNVTVVLPETILSVDAAGLRQAQTSLSTLARQQSATIVLGVLFDDGKAITNRALAFMPDGSSATYLKQNLVPGHEGNLTAGHRDLIIKSPIAGTGIAICKDTHFPTLGRRYAQMGTKLLLAPANEFRVDANKIITVAAMRGIEGGYTVARAATNGVSAVTDPYGRVIAQRRTGAQIGQLVSRLPPPLTAPPLYVRIGDLFGWMCLIAWLGIAIGIKWRRANSVPVAT